LLETHRLKLAKAAYLRKKYRVTGSATISSPPHQLANLWPRVLLPSVAKAEAPRLAELSAANWQWLTAQALRHGVAPLWYATVQTLLPKIAASAALQPLHQPCRQAAMVALLRATELRRVLEALTDAGIQPVVFKGAALAHTLYPSPACRPMSDLDLWVTHDDMPTAIRALSTLKYQLYEKEHRPHALTEAADGEVQMRPGQPGQGLVELHWGVFPGEWLARTATIDRAGVRQRLVAGKLVDRPVWLLAPEDAFIQLALHLSITHQMSFYALRNLLDLALLAERGLDWTAVCQRAKAWRVATAVGLTLDLLGRLFHLPAAAALAEGFRHTGGDPGPPRSH
jgi:hypothetical protein